MVLVYYTSWKMNGGKNNHFCFLRKDNESSEGLDILRNSKYSEEEDIYHFEMAHKYVKKGEKPK